MRSLWKLTWIEIKIFAREPLGLVGALVMPVIVFVVLGRSLGARVRSASPAASRLVAVDVPIFAAILIALASVMSLVTIIAIYREGGILKRLRATPLRPHTILSAHVLVKLLFTAATLALLLAAGRRMVPIGIDVPILRFGAALLLVTVTASAIGFVIASLVPGARFAQPMTALILYPMVAISGLFVAVDALPPRIEALARVNPFTYAVSLLKGAWLREPWTLHLGDIGALLFTCVVCTAISAKIFRWE